MKNKIKVQDTAFITSSFRTSREDVSKDIYAKLWSTENSQHWAKIYTDRVSKYEPYAHCLRNRYFLETFKKFTLREDIDVIINFGCGFSMYPYLLPSNIHHIEIDKSSVVKHKDNQTSIWIEDGKLPKRDVQRIAVDFSKDYETKLSHILKPILKNKKTCILLEGVLFFLDIQEANRLFTFFKSIQQPGDLVGAVSFQTILEETTVFKKMIEFSFGNSKTQFKHLTLNDAYYWNLKNYQLIDRQDFYSLSKTYAGHNKIEDSDDILSEQMYLLKRL